MKTLQVGGLSSSVGSFGSDCITLFLYKLWCLSSTCEVSNTDSGVRGVGRRDARVSGKVIIGTLGHLTGATGGGKDVFQPCNTNGRSLETRKWA